MKKVWALFLVFILAFVAGIMRHSLSQWLSPGWGTAIVNFSGTVFLAFFIKGIFSEKKASKNLLTIFSSGFIGSFTTFAAPLLLMLQALQEGDWAKFSFWFLIYFLGGIGAVRLSIYLAKRRMERQSD
ncbi:CrcB family protein [Streptococcus sp. H31]|uniref:fluoride efflux transporter FluC n=1 Tax=Streptococcus huangxiaojuni TaxID=3237239 RepID=UPI0034A0D9CD